jgi:hypothetical protein
VTYGRYSSLEVVDSCSSVETIGLDVERERKKVVDMRELVFADFAERIGFDPEMSDWKNAAVEQDSVMGDSKAVAVAFGECGITHHALSHEDVRIRHSERRIEWCILDK